MYARVSKVVVDMCDRERERDIVKHKNEHYYYKDVLRLTCQDRMGVKMYLDGIANVTLFHCE